jgi:hypothetical protein
MSLTARYQRIGDLEDLESAVQIWNEVVAITPGDQSDRPSHLRGLAISLTARYQRIGDLKDLVAAHEVAEKAANLTPEGHPERARNLQSLAMSLMC